MRPGRCPRSSSRRGRRRTSSCRGLAERNARIRGAVTVLLPEQAEDCATAVLSLGVGPGVQRALDPEVGVDVLAGVIRVLAGGSRRGFPVRRAETLPSAERTDLGFYGP